MTTTMMTTEDHQGGRLLVVGHRRTSMSWKRERNSSPSRSGTVTAHRQMRRYCHQQKCDESFVGLRDEVVYEVERIQQS